MFFCLSDMRYLIVFFFFSSRRRHTRSLRDWSSDVCSSDLLTIYDGTRSDAVLFGDGQSGICTTPTYEWVRGEIGQIGAQVVVVDGVSDTYASNENARANVKAFVRAIRNLIPADGAALLIAHVDKGSANKPNTSQGYSGSTGWNNSVRARWYLRPEVGDAEDSAPTDDRVVVLELQKV